MKIVNGEWRCEDCENEDEQCRECGDAQWEWESEKPLRDVESGKALEDYYDRLSSYDHPDSY